MTEIMQEASVDHKESSCTLPRPLIGHIRPKRKTSSPALKLAAAVVERTARKTIHGSVQA